MPTSCPSFFVLYLCIHFFSYGCQSSIKLFFVTLQDVNNTNVETWLIWTIPTNTNERTLKGSIGTVSKKGLVDNGNIRLDNLIMTSAETVKLYKSQPLWRRTGTIVFGNSLNQFYKAMYQSKLNTLTPNWAINNRRCYNNIVDLYFCDPCNIISSLTSYALLRDFITARCPCVVLTVFTVGVRD